MDQTYMTVPQMMEYLHISKNTAYRLILTKKIPSYRPSTRKTLVRREDIDRYLAKHKM